MKYGCEGKEDILGMLSIMILHAPNDFPPEFEGMDMPMAWATIEYGLKQLEAKDGRPEVMAAVRKMREQIEESRALFERGEVNPACHKLQDVEDILRPLNVNPEAR
jgi:hypothetical protein